MKNGKKTIIITLILIFTFITILVVYLSSKVENKPHNNINPQNNERVVKKVDSYEEFFAIQNTLNSGTDLNTSYIIEEIVLNKISNTNYYFIKCSKFTNDFYGENLGYEKNIFYLLISNNGKYQLTEINEEIDDLLYYAKNYLVKDVEIKSDKTLKKGYASEQNILTLYIEYYKYLLLVDQRLAYNMLDDKTKSDYIDYSNFYNQTLNIYNKLSSKIFAFNKQEDGDINTYYVEDDNRNKIIITENGIMDFKISY